jgi:hypothetical protein
VQTTAAPHPSARTYPDQAADVALCDTFNADIQTGDTYDIGAALQQAAGTISPKLAGDIQAVVNGGSLQQDLMSQLHATQDCALAKVGVQPRDCTSHRAGPRAAPGAWPDVRAVPCPLALPAADGGRAEHPGPLVSGDCMAWQARYRQFIADDESSPWAS